MKTLIKRAVFFLTVCALVFALVQFQGTETKADAISVSASGPGPGQVQLGETEKPKDITYLEKDMKLPVDAVKAKSWGERMVDFIRELLGDKPKPVDEDLIRDEE